MREKHRIFKCDTCDFTSSSEVGLKVHITKVHARLYPIETNQQKPDIPVEKSSNSINQRVAEKIRYMCPSCQKFCSTEHRLFNHVYPYERWEKLSYRGKEEIKCDICEYTDFYCSSMVSHKENVHKRTYSSLANLQSKHTHHWNDEPTSAKCNVECKL